jgi:hypothetical protein
MAKINSFSGMLQALKDGNLSYTRLSNYTKTLPVKSSNFLVSKEDYTPINGLATIDWDINSQTYNMYDGMTTTTEANAGETLTVVAIFRINRAIRLEVVCENGYKHDISLESFLLRNCELVLE